VREIYLKSKLDIKREQQNSKRERTKMQNYDNFKRDIFVYIMSHLDCAMKVVMFVAQEKNILFVLSQQKA